MPDDILDAAQKAINDAAGKLQDPSPQPEPTVKPTSTDVSAGNNAPLPPEPAPAIESAAKSSAPLTEASLLISTLTPAPPTPMATSVSTVPSPEPAHAVSEKTTASDTSSTTPSIQPNDASKLVESILDNGAQSTIVAPLPGPHNQPPKAKKSVSGILIGIVALFLLALPVGVYYVSNSNGQLADTRGRATGGNPYALCKTGQPGYACCGADPNACPGQGGPAACHCQGGDACTGTVCEPIIPTSCAGQGRSWCTNQTGAGGTCCVAGYVCATGVNGCTPGGNPTTPPCTGNGCNPNPTNTPVPGVHQCLNLKILKGGTQVTPSTLQSGDAVVLSVAGDGSPSKAHFRINGGAWQESTTAGAGAGTYILNYTIPSGITDFQIEAEVFVDGAWK